MTTKEDPQDVGPFAMAMARAMASREPMKTKEYRDHVFRTEISPQIERWGYEKKFRVQIKDWNNKHQERVFQRALKLLTGCGAIVALVGIRGTGKTTITAQIAIARSWQNYEEGMREDNGCHRRITACSYRKATDLISRYKSIYSDSGSIETESLMASRGFYCRSVELATIDELHECDDQKLKNRVLADILDRRYAAQRDTIIISNQTPEEFQKTTSDSIMSRITEHGQVIPCNWESWRARVSTSI